MTEQPTTPNLTFQQHLDNFHAFADASKRELLAAGLDPTTTPMDQWPSKAQALAQLASISSEQAYQTDPKAWAEWVAGMVETVQKAQQAKLN